MLVETACFDPNTNNLDQGGIVDDGFSQSHVPNCSPSFSIVHHHNPHHHHQQQQEVAAAMAVELQLQQQLNMEMEESSKCINANGLQEVSLHQPTRNQFLSSYNDPSTWEDMAFGYHHQQEEHHQHMQQLETQSNIQHQSFNHPLPENPYPPDLLSMLPLLPYSSISFANSATEKSSGFLGSLGLLGHPAGGDGGAAAASSSVVYDPLLPVSLAPQSPLLRELIQSLPNGYGLGGLSGGSLFGGVDDRVEASGDFFQDGDGSRSNENGVFEFTADMKGLRKSRDGKGSKHFVTERQRRVQLNDKYQALRSLVPSPSKNDRASVVGDAIEYINELKRTVAELKILVEKKRCSTDRLKRHKVDNGAEGAAAKTEDDLDQPYNGSAVRSSWLHRKSKTTEVDVRIIDDEVTVKLVQQKRINCLLFASKVLDELQLDLHHLAGGLIGDYYSYFFNSKISEGSTVYAHAIANKLIEVVDKQYAAVQPTSSY